jgi:hypothetical protein
VARAAWERLGPRGMRLRRLYHGAVMKRRSLQLCWMMGPQSQRWHMHTHAHAYTPVLHMHQMTDGGHNRLTSSTARGYRVTFHRGCDMSQCIAYLSGGSEEQELRQHARSPLWPRQVRERDGEDVRALRRLQGSSSRLRVADPGSLPV